MAAIFMKRCIDLAQKGLGHVAPNPMVGALVVHNDQIIGEGWHRQFGKAHAEENALNSVAAANRDKIVNSALYVTLEPCHHLGKTPPCVDRIIKEKIKKVVIGCLDPNPLTKGKSVQKLLNAGIGVELGVLEKDCKHLIRSFAVQIKEHRPFIVLKWAESKDGFIGKAEQQIWLTNHFSKILVHKWRSYFDAILIGWKTLKIDEPELTNRRFYGTSPKRLVVDYDLKYPDYEELKVKKVKTVVFNTKQEGSFKNVSFAKFNKHQSFDSQLCNYCSETNINSLIVEGGARTHELFVKMNFWDEAWVFETANNLGSGIHSAAFKGHLVGQTTLATDTLKIYERL